MVRVARLLFFFFFPDLTKETRRTVSREETNKSRGSRAGTIGASRGSRSAVALPVQTPAYLCVSSMFVAGWVGGMPIASGSESDWLTQRGSSQRHTPDYVIDLIFIM